MAFIFAGCGQSSSKQKEIQELEKQATELDSVANKLEQTKEDIEKFLYWYNSQK